MARGEFISALYASPHCKSTMWKCFPVAVLKLLLRLLESLWERKSWYSQDILATKLVFPGRCQGLSAHLLWFDWFLTICHFWDLPHCPWCSPTCDPSPRAALSIFPPSAFHFKTEKKKKGIWRVWFDFFGTAKEILATICCSVHLEWELMQS